MTLSGVETRLRAALAGPLPGAEAHLALAPRPARPGWRPAHYPADARPAAGLLLLLPIDDNAHVILTVRASQLPQHPGQIALPGGAIDAGETVEQAALREAQEEIALNPADVRVLGSLSPLHIPVSRFVLFPIVGLADRRLALYPAHHEVARILEAPLADLLDPTRLRCERQVHTDGQPRTVPYFDVRGEKVWGATAMILAELLFLLGHRPDPWK